MRFAPISLIAFLAALPLVLGASIPAGRSSPAGAVLDTEEQNFLAIINQYRQQNGRGTLVSTATMESAAEWMSADMGAERYFDHTDSLGRDPWTRLCNFGYCYNTYKGENILAGTGNAQAAFNLWKDSPGHNANMLNANFKVIGIGRVYTAGSPYGWYWTTDFGGYIPPGSTPSPTSTVAPTPTVPPTPLPTATPTASPSPTLAPTPTASPSPTTAPTPTASPTPQSVPTATPLPTATPAPTPSMMDSDGDGFANSVEAALATSWMNRCGNFDTTKPGAPSQNWPADLVSGTSANRVDFSDLTSFLAPVRRIYTSESDTGFDSRWDLVPGAGNFGRTINILDLTSLVTLSPPMFGGVRAFGGPNCS
jgi:uncharacterized protein YkwD